MIEKPYLYGYGTDYEEREEPIGTLMLCKRLACSKPFIKKGYGQTYCKKTCRNQDATKRWISKGKISLARMKKEAGEE